MSLNVEGFDQVVQAGSICIEISSQHPLIKLAQKLPWDALLEIMLADLQRTQKLRWWVGRPLRIRIHLGIYLLQQLFDLTDRYAEYALHDNAAFRIFCGYGLMEKWHVPDHTKIEEFRSRLLPETQRKLANFIAAHAVKLNYANPSKLDIDSTVQEANISYPSAANLLVKIAALAKKLVNPLNQLKDKLTQTYQVNLKRLKALLLYHFLLKRDQKHELSVATLKSLWREVFEQVWPIVKNSYQLINLFSLPKYWNLRRALEQLQWRGYRFLELLYQELFEDIMPVTKMYSLHAYEVHCFNKGKLSKKKEYGRAFQLGRIEGNFMLVGECTSVLMPDAQSLPAMVKEHEYLFSEKVLASHATDKGYYALDNLKLLEEKQVKEIGLPRPNRVLHAPQNKTCGEVMEQLHNSRAGIEALIGHLKHGWQMGRSRMKSDNTTLASGYAAVLGFNLRQLKRYAVGKVCPNFSEKLVTNEESDKIAENTDDWMPAMQFSG